MHRIYLGRNVPLAEYYRDRHALSYRPVRKSGNSEYPQPTINSSPMKIIPVSSMNVMIVSPSRWSTSHPPYSSPVSAHDESAQLTKLCLLYTSGTEWLSRRTATHFRPD